LSEQIGLQHDGHASSVNLIVEPLPDPGQTGLVVLAFQDIISEPLAATSRNSAQHRSRAEFEKLLLLAEQRLRVVSDGLEAANDALQASNQEFLAVNEELQSANEELETSKEELQSLNEALEASNAALHQHNSSLVRSGSDLRNLFDSTSIATLFLDSALNIRRFTPQLLDIFNLREGDEGRPIGDIVTRLKLSTLPQDVLQVLSTRKSVEREVTAVSGMTYLMQIRPYRELNNAVNGAVLTFVDISERKLHENARSHLAAIVESSPDGIISHDLAGIITSWNAGAELLFGFTAVEAIGEALSNLLHAPHPEHWPHIGTSAADKQPVERFETVLITKLGQELEASITISPVRDAEGQIIGSSVVARDISERKAMDRKAELLLGELDHRVKNILAVVSAVVSQTLSSGLTPEAFGVEIEGRIRAVAKAHSLLTNTGHGTLSLHDVIATELAPYDGNPGHIVVRGPDVDMTPKAGLALAMAVHELTSNAAKYGALSTQQGHLEVISSLLPGPAGMMFGLDWTEANGPPVVPPTRRGFGTSLIERALAYELDAQVTRSFAASGVVCRVLIPLTEEVGHVQPCPAL
jgi:two-component system CheB/CheR fusion protein